MRSLGWLAVSFLMAVPVMAETKVKVGGQVRPRFEVKEPVGPGHDVTTSMRVRANLTANEHRAIAEFLKQGF